MTERTRRLVITGTAFAGSWLSALLPLVAYYDRLPEPLATHWNLSGEADSAMPRALLLALFTLAHGACAWFAHKAARRPTFTESEVASIGTLSFLCWVLSGAVLSTVWLNVDAGVWQDSGRFSPWLLLWMLALPAAATRLIRSLLARYASDPAPAPANALELGKDERVFWSGSATNPWFGRWALVCLGVGIVLLSLVPWPSALVALALAPLLALFARLRVTIDERRLTVHYGSIGFVKQRFDLARVQRAEAIDVAPLRHGGWATVAA